LKRLDKRLEKLEADWVDVKKEIREEIEQLFVSELKKS
jgi:hypothetical protein